MTSELRVIKVGQFNMHINRCVLTSRAQWAHVWLWTSWIEVMSGHSWGHVNFLTITSYRKRYRRARGLIVFNSSRRVAWYACLPILTQLDLKATRPEVNFWPWPFGVIWHIFLCVSTRGTRWRSNYCSRFLPSKVIGEKLFVLCRS